VPKRDLMTGLQIALENGTLMIAKQMKQTKALVRELTDIKVNGMKMGAEGSNRDDLVIAVALAVWKARHPKKYNSFGTVRLF
jgi:hypothetical protein